MNCPNCQSDVKVTEQNYGSLFTCPSCQAAYFINFEGAPEFGTMETPPIADGDYNVAPITFSEPTIDPGAQPTPDFDPGAQIFQTLQPDMTSFTNEQSEFSQVAQDISSFGNSESQMASLNYDLIISGLDTVEILKLFKEAIDDSRFGWELNSTMKTIRNGQISLLRLNPVKAYILSKRLQFLDVDKKWKQNVLS